MVYKLCDLDNKMGELIIKSYNLGHNVGDILKSYDVCRNTVLSLLYNNGIMYKRTESSSFNVNGNKLLIIADTHIGNIQENFNYIDQAYETGLKEGVVSCIHLGDLFQGNFSVRDKSISYQLNAFEKYYPKVNEFITNLAMGNHEKGMFDEVPEAFDVLKTRQDFNVVGYRRVYFTWNNYMFGMSHKIDKFGNEFSSEDTALDISGHGHVLKIKSNSSLKVGTLSDNMMPQYKDALPSFLIATLEDDFLYIDAYTFENNKAKLLKRDYFTKEMHDYYKTKY